MRVSEVGTIVVPPVRVDSWRGRLPPPDEAACPRETQSPEHVLRPEHHRMVAYGQTWSRTTLRGRRERYLPHPLGKFFRSLTPSQKNPKNCSADVRCPVLLRNRGEDKAQFRYHLCGRDGASWRVRTARLGLITRRSCLQSPFSMIRLACTRLRRHPSARFIDGR